MLDVLTLPADHHALTDLPTGIGDLCAIVQGLLIHDASALSLYGQPPAGFQIDRTTKPVLERIEMATAGHNPPLSTPRPPFERQVGTCRDYAAMLCALARVAGLGARVRCGFAAYLGTNPYEDHWVTEHGDEDRSDWAVADAQLDPEHREELGIRFAITTVPRARFMTADEAWRQWRKGGVSARQFGHGTHSGERLLLVNLIRDALATSDILVSPWDRWRELGDVSEPLDPVVLDLGDRIASGDLAAIDPIGRLPPFDHLRA